MAPVEGQAKEMGGEAEAECEPTLWVPWGCP